jgi:hypothetical protein
MRWPTLILVTAVLATMLAACGGGDDDDASATTSTPDPITTTATVESSPGRTEPTPEASVSPPAETATVETSTAATATVATDTTPPASQPPAAGGEPLVGDVTLEDGSGDVLDTASDTPLPDSPPGADIVAVRLAGDGSQLILTFTAATPFPTGSDDPATDWWVDILIEGQVTHEIKLFYGFGDWTVTYFDFGTANLSGTELEVTPAVEGTVLTLAVPAESLPGLSAPFAWYAASSGIMDTTFWSDYAPDEAASMFFSADEVAQFP